MNYQTNPPTEDSSYLQTVGRALELLELVGQTPGLTLSEIARQTEMSTTVAYRILYTLGISGFLHQEPNGKRYYPGEKALLLGFQAIDAQEIRRISQHYMWDYYEKTGENCILTAPCQGLSLCLEKISSLRDSSSAVRVGCLYPLHRGASNRVLLAFMPREEQQRYLDKLELPPGNRETLQAKLDLAVANGYDYSIGVLSPGRFGLGFPVFDRKGQLAGALSTGGYIADLTDEMLAGLIRRIGQVAAHVNVAMGAPNRA